VLFRSSVVMFDIAVYVLFFSSALGSVAGIRLLLPARYEWSADSIGQSCGLYNHPRSAGHPLKVESRMTMITRFDSKTPFLGGPDPVNPCFSKGGF